MTPEELLMRKIKLQWGPHIQMAVSSSSIPQAFVAALVSLESGGNPTAERYEPKAAARLKVKYPEWDADRLYDNSTSWGLLQIMGENYPGNPKDLVDPDRNLTWGVGMLSKFVQRFNLDIHEAVTSDKGQVTSGGRKPEFEQLFRCWNSGQPDGATFDPSYVDKGLHRMEIYKALS